MKRYLFIRFIIAGLLSLGGLYVAVRQDTVQEGYVVGLWTAALAMTMMHQPAPEWEE